MRRSLGWWASKPWFPSLFFFFWGGGWHALLPQWLPHLPFTSVKIINCAYSFGHPTSTERLIANPYQFTVTSLQIRLLWTILLSFPICQWMSTKFNLRAAQKLKTHRYATTERQSFAVVLKCGHKIPQASHETKLFLGEFGGVSDFEIHPFNACPACIGFISTEYWSCKLKAPLSYTIRIIFIYLKSINGQKHPLMTNHINMSYIQEKQTLTVT